MLFQTARMQSMYLYFYSKLYTMQSTYLVPWSTLNCKPRMGDDDGQGCLIKCKNQSVQFLDLWAFVQTCLPCALMVSLWADVIYTPPLRYTTTQHLSLRMAINLTKGLLYQSPISLSATHMLIFKWIAPCKLHPRLHVLSPRALCKLQLPG